MLTFWDGTKGAVIETKISLQWFLKMEDITKTALDFAVMDDVIQLYSPEVQKHRIGLGCEMSWSGDFPPTLVGTSDSAYYCQMENM